MIHRRTFLGAAAASVAAAPAAAQPSPPLPPSLAGLRDLALRTPEGASTTLGAVLPPGRPAVVSLWATWCAPCQIEAAHLAKVRARLPASALGIVGVNLDRRADEARIAAFLRQARVNFPQLRGDAAVYRAFGGGDQIVLPRLYIFGADGRPTAVFGRYVQFVTVRQIDRAIAAVL